MNKCVFAPMQNAVLDRLEPGSPENREFHRGRAEQEGASAGWHRAP